MLNVYLYSPSFNDAKNSLENTLSRPKNVANIHRLKTVQIFMIHRVLLFIICYTLEHEDNTGICIFMNRLMIRFELFEIYVFDICLNMCI